MRLPPTVPLTGAYMSDAGAYLLDSGRIFVLWLGKRVPKDFISQVAPGRCPVAAAVQEPAL